MLWRKQMKGLWGVRFAAPLEPSDAGGPNCICKEELLRTHER
jgi:hypothetical protein